MQGKEHFRGYQGSERPWVPEVVWIFEELSMSKIILTAGVNRGILKEIWTLHTKLEHIKHFSDLVLENA